MAVNTRKGQELYARARARIPGGTQLLSKRPEMLLPDQWPSYFSKAKGAEVWDLDGQRGRWVVVNFFSTTCVPCIREHPELVAFAEAHVAADDVRVVSVAFDDSASAVEAFFRRNGGTWPVLAVDTGRIAVDWGVVAVPESYLVTPSGHVAAKVIGGVEQDDLEDLLDRARTSVG